MSKICNQFFEPGRITIVMDGGAGSSGKAKLGSYITENSDNWSWCCNTFAPQAGHWTVLADGRKFFYQTLNSCAYNHEKFEKMYIGPGAIIELPALFKEMEENGIPRSKIGISPIVAILDYDLDQGFERGTMGFDGEVTNQVHTGTAKFGSTAHGVGSCAARKVLRRESLKVARDIPELADMICDVPAEIMARLEAGQSGFMEIAQGFQLSNQYSMMYPYCTYRNVTVAQGMSDMFLPTRYAGQVILNFRTYPIRINSNKYIGADGEHLTYAQVQAGVPHTVYEGNSGPGYADQTETTWEAVTESAGSPTPIFEITSVTKLPRRVFTFSRENVIEAIKYNKTDRPIWTSINFANYVDHDITGLLDESMLGDRWYEWLFEYFPAEHLDTLRFIGTGAETEAMIMKMLPTEEVMENPCAAIALQGSDLSPLRGVFYQPKAE